MLKKKIIFLHFCMTTQAHVSLGPESFRFWEKDNLNRSDDSRLLQHLKPATPLALDYLSTGAIWSKSQWHQMELQEACCRDRIKVCVLGPLGQPAFNPLLHDSLLMFGMQSMGLK